MRCRRPMAVIMSTVALSGVAIGCGGDGGAVDDPDPDFADETVVEATVEQVLRDPENFSENPVVVRGIAHRIGDLGFLLTNDGNAIFVGAPESDLDELERGDEVAVRGELSQIDDTRAETIRDALDGDGEAVELPEGVEPADVGSEKPILNLRVLHGAGPGDPPPAGSF